MSKNEDPKNHGVASVSKTVSVTLVSTVGPMAVAVLAMYGINHATMPDGPCGNFNGVFADDDRTYRAKIMSFCHGIIESSSSLELTLENDAPYGSEERVSVVAKDLGLDGAWDTVRFYSGPGGEIVFAKSGVKWIDPNGFIGELPFSQEELQKIVRLLDKARDAVGVPERRRVDAKDLLDR